jgi:hypothetical protein
MLQSLFNVLFGCSHTRTTFPLTPARQRIGTYVSCLDCGKEFSYDWKSMQIGQPVANRAPAPRTQPSFR